MIRLQPYKNLSRLIEHETFEPAVDWGLRMAFAAMIPVIWGSYTGNMLTASWITLTAESICWVELKGSFGTRLRVLFGGTFLTLLFSFLGSVTGGNLWLSIAAMLVVAFVAGLFKNLGDRGSGLAISVYVMFIISNAYPTDTFDTLKERLILTGTGGLWALIVGVVASVYIPAQAPYRRTVALIWRANAGLLKAISTGWDGKGLRSNLRAVYLKEKEVRAAIDHSLHFYETTAHQANKKDLEEYNLAQLRKITSLVGVHIEAIGDELLLLKIHETDKAWAKNMHTMLKAMEESMERMAVYTLLLKPEEELLLLSRLNRLNKSIVLLKEQNNTLGENSNIHILKRITQLAERISKLITSVHERLRAVGNNKSVLRPYPLVKSLVMLYPTRWQKNIMLLLNPNTNTARYALRSALAATAALVIYRVFDITHGYWLPFTVMLVMQPYFGATLQKAIDRVVGTVGGVLVGGVLVALPTGLYLKEAVLFVCFVLMIYFLRKKYSISAFFITLSLVVLFDVEQTFNNSVIFIRVLATVGGAAIAILAGFALLPTWDRKWLPIHLTRAINNNYRYFINTFYAADTANWTKMKRLAESQNSNAYDSFIRYMQEPGNSKPQYIPYYQLISHNVRVTRLLNNINVELESAPSAPSVPDDKTVHLLHGIKSRFNAIVHTLHQRNPALQKDIAVMPEKDESSITLTIHQQQYLERLSEELKSIEQDLEHLLHIPTSESLLK